MDWYTMHPFSGDFCASLQIVDGRIEKGGLATKYRDDTAIDAINLLYSLFQVDV